MAFSFGCVRAWLGYDLARRWSSKADLCRGAFLLYLMGYALCRRPQPLLIAPGLQILGIVASRYWHLFVSPKKYLACLVASLWNPGTLGSTRKDTLKSRLGFLLSFDGFRDPVLKAFWVPWTNKCVFCYACNASWVRIWMSRIGKLSILQGSIAKIKFRRRWNFIIPECIFHDFGRPWDQFSCLSLSC